MKFFLCEDNGIKLQNSAGEEYGPKDIVSLKIHFSYHTPEMNDLVQHHHVFVVVETDETNNKLLVYAMTSKLDRKDRYPEFYHEVQSGYRRALVELNAWGWVPVESVYRKIAKMSDKDFYELSVILEDPDIERTTICEKSHIIT